MDSRRCCFSLSVGYHHRYSPRCRCVLFPILLCRNSHSIRFPSVINNATHLNSDHSSYRIPIAIQFVWASVLAAGMLCLPEVSVVDNGFALFQLTCRCSLPVGSSSVEMMRLLPLPSAVSLAILSTTLRTRLICKKFATTWRRRRHWARVLTLTASGLPRTGLLSEPGPASRSRHGSN